MIPPARRTKVCKRKKRYLLLHLPDIVRMHLSDNWTLRNVVFSLRDQKRKAQDFKAQSINIQASRGSSGFCCRSIDLFNRIFSLSQAVTPAESRESRGLALSRVRWKSPRRVRCRNFLREALITRWISVTSEAAAEQCQVKTLVHLIPCSSGVHLYFTDFDLLDWHRAREILEDSFATSGYLFTQSLVRDYFSMTIIKYYLHRLSQSPHF